VRQIETGDSSCVKFNGWANRTGHHLAWAAIWTSLNFSSFCYVTYTVTYVNTLTGAVFVGGSGQLLNASFSGTIDADNLDFSTSYTVTLTIADEAGLALIRQTATVTTPAARADA